MNIFKLFILSIMLFNCSAIGVISGGLIDRSHYKSEIRETLHLTEIGDSIYVQTFRDSYSGLFDSLIDENYFIIKTDSIATKIALRDVKAFNRTVKSYKWTSILTGVGILFDGFIAIALIAIGSMH